MEQRQLKTAAAAAPAGKMALPIADEHGPVTFREGWLVRVPLCGA